MNKHAETEWMLQGQNLAAERADLRAKIDGHQLALRGHLTEAMRAHHERMIKNLTLALANLG
jgi:hypothetical protein